MSSVASEHTLNGTGKIHAVVGRPTKYQTVEQLQILIDEYFESLIAEREGVQVFIRPPTVTGLALALGMTRKQIVEYREREEFRNSIVRAKQIVEQYNEESLIVGRNSNGVQFNLKNNFDGWKDQKDVDITSGGKALSSESLSEKQIEQSMAQIESELGD